MHILALFDNQLVRIIDCDQPILFFHLLKNLKTINFYEQIMISNFNTEEWRPFQSVSENWKLNWGLKIDFNIQFRNWMCITIPFLIHPQKIEDWKLNLRFNFQFKKIWKLNCQHSIKIWKLNDGFKVQFLILTCQWIIGVKVNSLYLHCTQSCG